MSRPLARDRILDASTTLAAEVRDPAHPVHRAAWTFKRELRDYPRQLLSGNGAQRLESRAAKLLLVGRAAVRAAMEGGVAPTHSTRAAAAALLRPVDP